jgi:predicted dehydrogenase
MARQIGYAVVGLGPAVRAGVLPAFARAGEPARLVAVVGADRARAQALGQEFRAAAYHQDEFRQCLQRDDVNAVYIALPNAMHCDYTVEAARAGVHVLCERPMAVTADECRRMLRTCQTNRVKLMVAYRLHAQPAYQRLDALVRAGALGALRTLSADLTLRVDDADDPRVHRRLGGGTVYDLGVVALQVARAFLGSEPAQVMAMTARGGRRHGGDIDEATVALVRFPDERLAHVHTSFAAEAATTFTLFGEEGLVRLDDPFATRGPARLTLVRGGAQEEETFAPVDLFAAELAHFAACILQDRPPEPSGLEGLQDVRIVEAIYRSARDGRPVTLPRIARAEGPGLGDRRQAS